MSCFRRLWVMVMVWLGMAAVGWGLIDQSQPNYSYTADLSSYGTSGQTFQAGMDGLLVGIRLMVEGRGGSGPYGSAFRVDLHQVSFSNVVNPQVLVSGTRQKTGILRVQPQWIEILFDEPYPQTQGQRLAFTIQELSGGGTSGWNQYGMQAGNVYAGGRYFGHYTTSPLTTSNTDFAFETIVIPEPATLMLLAAGWIIRRGGKFKRG